ncbi:adenosylmethionine--8-amino-7-oxononanoate transaminase [Halomonas sp. MCCC 1A17488]|uniref:Adenosylmethionine-8-amino-7-oxononanoate aminotransferase n=1 Tax=Billgrantia sulfidoxydans TaxID=2733484 RepID=A0ABX7W704_9GAMM|nr:MULTISPECIES: adenosylmethionine--8-amino-7-oxononanoate transaminase [Halomonas]MCE8014656.1 adenosylmethionine--8-amino-7-oxononanoate transaminase [Halomonas sp. MCCC 1A17488]MCG3237989.1 adenosylmethionine--8-amino-7-oxononanoate transaminase [Halomonas sp. MCCC 1A17488]QPP48230.1 adenosylmethionine--8-amino-7-oxononanoate transaminase [Halomonas sp. SS10-MC5]QTP55530.1 adenosylmethionine--8-amino-7-oxononanoate transaminase [Halomonas sulfidoxydans]
MTSPVWHPYAHLLTQPAAPRVVGGEGPRFTLDSGETLLDATCSWWCMIHGYAHPRLVAAIKEQADTLCHVMLGGLTHEPADRLARELVRVTPPGLNHVFFSDSGSVGMEVAMKMAVQYHHLRGRPEKHRMLSLMKAYHGDTSGCMAVCDPEEGMHSLFAGYLPSHHFAPAPTAPYDADADAVAHDLAALRTVLERHHHEIAALLMEPLLQAAGGLNMTSPSYLTGARELCDEFDVLLVFDEVATGFGRTGRLFAADHAGVTPDIMVLSKGLTGGYLGHAATLATDRVHDAFIGETPRHAFMHGPTFMGNPLACRVALESLSVFEEENYLEKIAGLNQVLRTELLEDPALRRHPRVRDVRVLGATAVIEVDDAAGLEGVAAFARARGVWLRPFGRWLYTMPAYITPEVDMRNITGVMKDWFR